MKNEITRLSFFDWIRGLMILWTLIYHISLNYGIVTFGIPEQGASVFTIMSFFMATFYVSSGYFFSSKKNIKTFVQDKLRKLGSPYITFSIWGIFIFEVYSLVTSGSLCDFELLKTIRRGYPLENTPLWFLFSLFWCNIIYYIIYKLGGAFLNVFILICFILAYMTYNSTQILCYGNILLGLTFFHLGVLLKQYKDYLNRWYWGFISLIVFLSIGFIAPQRLEFVRNILVQGNWFVNYMYTVVACLLLWYVSQRWEHDNILGRGLISLGRNSIVIYAFHRPVLNWVIEPLIRVLNPSVSYLEFLTICIICIFLLYIMLNYILNRYCPILLGKYTNVEMRIRCNKLNFPQ